MRHFTSTQYLQIDIANNFGLDKKDWDERIKWVEDHEQELEDLLSQAKEPALYFAGVQAYRAAQRGEAIGYPISLDATSSGLQLLAALTGDRKAAELCNVVSVGKRMDAYTAVYRAMVEAIGEFAKIKREDTKRAIMTSLYGSQAVPKEVFGEGLLLRIFLETMQRVAPAAWELNEAFLTMWNPDALSNDWVLPDNFHVKVKVISQIKETVHFLNEPFDTFRKVNAPMEEGRSLGANTIHSLDGMVVREMTRRCDYDKQRIQDVKQVLFSDESIYLEDADHNVDMVLKLWGHYQKSGYLSARILDYIDTNTLMLVDPKVIQELVESLPAKPFKIIAIHDCFRVHPNYGNDLRIQYNHQLALIAKSNLLQYLLSQIMGQELSIGKLDPDLWKDIADTDYALS